MDSKCVKGIITQEGSATSHAAIVARAKGIPFISNIDTAVIKAQDNHKIILDGENGVILLHPSQDALQHYEELLSKGSFQIPAISGPIASHTETIDGYRVKVFANVTWLKK